MEQPVDAFIDQFQLSITPYGSVLNFSASQPLPPAPGTVQQAKLMASIRMSTEHLKVMTFILRRELMRAEVATGQRITLPSQLLNNLGISPDDWETLWK